MKIVMPSGHLEERFGTEKALSMIADAGFDGIDYTDCTADAISEREDYKECAENFRRMAEDKGLKIYQTHGPMVTGMLKKYDLEYVQKRTVRSIETASILGADAMVIHPIQDPLHKLGCESVYEKNMEFFKYFLPFAKEHNVKIAIENMCKTNPRSGVVGDGVCAHPLEFIRYLDDLGREYFTGCFDTGHCAATGREPHDVLRIVGGERITCLHIHDNDFASDKHLLPYSMSVDWEEFCKALADMGYKGHFTLEASNFIPKFPDEFVPVALKFKCDVARFMVSRVEAYLKNIG